MVKKLLKSVVKYIAKALYNLLLAAVVLIFIPMYALYVLMEGLE